LGHGDGRSAAVEHDDGGMLDSIMLLATSARHPDYFDSSKTTSNFNFIM
jgi:hypothetical protein